MTYFNNSIDDEGSAVVVTSMELAVSIQTTPERLMQSLKDIKIENISNESPLTAGEESSLTNSVQNNTIQTGMYVKIVNLRSETFGNSNFNLRSDTFGNPNFRTIKVLKYLTLFLPAKGRISPYMSITWPSLVGIGLS